MRTVFFTLKCRNSGYSLSGYHSNRPSHDAAMIHAAQSQVEKGEGCKDVSDGKLLRNFEVAYRIRCKSVTTVAKATLMSRWQVSSKGKGKGKGGFRG